MVVKRVFLERVLGLERKVVVEFLWFWLFLGGVCLFDVIFVFGMEIIVILWMLYIVRCGLDG